MAKQPICAVTHVRHEHDFLEKWIAHYAPIVGGRENLFVVIDGDDWEPKVDLSGIDTEVILDAPRRRIKNDRFMAKLMSGRANDLRKTYDNVIRGDVDEYVVIDPEADLDWDDALKEQVEAGYIFALGCDVVQGPKEKKPVDRTKPILGQRKCGYIADRYTKPFVISRWNNWAGGAHRLINRPVEISNHFVLFHMALADQNIAQERMDARGGTDQHRSFVGHQTDRLNAIADDGLAKPLDWEEARRIGMEEFPVEPEDGSPAPRPRPSRDPRNLEQGLPVRIPDRFFGLT
ncbi:glycosyltransferase family 2 protein [Hasllibacter sp. MH4015]|uniref:glycosyltransferase family 2 protein n=1 Tax=Hasllibacter sp. MH4015 TaxID=2854029 RepID=UPI001CD77445|nr:glycosyltransferase family 2 protein [Hasllibacter sp. MH4015]